MLSRAFVPQDGHWSPELDLPPSLWELFVPSDEASGDGLALAFGQRLGGQRLGGQTLGGQALGGSNAGRSWLWVQDGECIRRAGRPYLHGLPHPLRPGLLHVAARSPADALWAMEEGVRCGALHFVIGEIAGDPKCLDFTASRRLVLAAERYQVPLLLLRRQGSATLSAARLRWRIAAASSGPHRWNPRAPGNVVASAELFRGRAFRPQTFLLAQGGGDEQSGGSEGGGGGSGNRLHLVSPSCDRPVEPDYRETG